VRTYISEPDRGRRNWEDLEARDAVYRNRSIRGPRGNRLLRHRGKRLARPFAHFYRTGGMRRVHLRGRDNILKRTLLHTGALNLGLLMGSPSASARHAASKAASRRFWCASGLSFDLLSTSGTRSGRSGTRSLPLAPYTHAATIDESHIGR
jgi:hypothetical protein